jgi:hypothetical protein
MNKCKRGCCLGKCVRHECKKLKKDESFLDEAVELIEDLAGGFGLLDALDSNDSDDTVEPDSSDDDSDFGGGGFDGAGADSDF